METVAVQELVVPEIPVVETDYDKYEGNRMKLINKLKSGDLKQSRGAWEGPNGEVCILQAAFNEIN